MSNFLYHFFVISGKKSYSSYSS